MWNRRNIVLAIVFILLLTGIYVIEEKGALSSGGAASIPLSERAVLLDRSHLVKIDFPGGSIVKKNGEWMTSATSWPVSMERWSQFLDRMESIRIIQRVSLPVEPSTRVLLEQDAIGSFSFYDQSGSVTTIRIGAVIPLTYRFHVERRLGKETELLICEDATPYYGAYRAETILLEKYKAMKAAMPTSEDSFFDRHILSGPDTRGWGRVLMGVADSRLFEVNLREQTTIPTPVQHVRISKSAFERFQNELSQLTFERVMAGDVKDVASPVATMHVVGERISELSVYRRWKNENGWFLMVGGRPWVYEISGERASLFMRTVQDFWDKRPVMDDETLGKTDVAFLIEFDSQTAFKMMIPRGTTFDVGFAPGNNGELTSKLVINKTRFRELFNLLFAIGDFSEAHRVSLFTPELRQIYEGIPGIKIFFKENTFRLIQKQDEFILSDYSRGHSLHYLVDKDILGTRLHHYFSGR